MKKISIKPTNNGPLKIINNTKQNLENILFYENKPITIEKCILLCRCGKTKKQPYCDGSHIKHKFNSLNELKDEIIQVYKSKDITITFNRSICSGAANCVRDFPNIYTSASENWIYPDLGTKKEIIESIRNCPSGALSYSLNDEKNVNVCNLENCLEEKIELFKNSPIYVRGSIDIEVQKWSFNANKTKFALCRCGKSKNKPFCDYSHAL